MSSSASSSSSDNGRTDREPAKRAFAAEFADANEMFTESDEERAPKYAVLPTGECANRVFAVGTLTEAEDIGSESEYWQARVVDPTGTFFIYAGQYQPEAMSALREIEAPEFVAVVGKSRSYESDDGDMLTSLTSESITVVDEATRERWVIETAGKTLERVAAFREGMSSECERARAAYGEEIADYERATMEALASVAGIELVDEDESEGSDAE